MPLDEARTEDTRGWLDKARADIRAAHVDLEAVPPLLEDALFHCQQAVEKALKGFLTWHDQPFRKVHDLVELGVQCAEIDSTMEELLRRSAKLSQFATAYRYPGLPAPPGLPQAKDAESLAREVLDHVLARLPEGI